VGGAEAPETGDPTNLAENVFARSKVAHGVVHINPLSIVRPAANHPAHHPAVDDNGSGQRQSGGGLHRHSPCFPILVSLRRRLVDFWLIVLFFWGLMVLGAPPRPPNQPKTISTHIMSPNPLVGLAARMSSQMMVQGPLIRPLRKLPPAQQR
jgi:hypothetical protein